MSLNGSEQMLMDYLGTHRDERQHWEAKVRALGNSSMDIHEAAIRLEVDLWAYFKERSAVVKPFKELADREGLRRTSLQNLAEYLLRLWTPPRAKPKPSRDK